MEGGGLTPEEFHDAIDKAEIIKARWNKPQLSFMTM